MKKTLALLCFIIIAGCTKTKQPDPDYGVYGIQDMLIMNDGYGVSRLPLKIDYYGDIKDSEQITLSVSDLPDGITMDNSWQTSGTPPFQTTLVILDTSASRAYAGKYSFKLTAKSSRSGTRVFNVNLTVQNPPMCVNQLEGKYLHCYSYGTNKNYIDSVYADGRVPNRLWFTNFNNSGQKVYADMNCNTMLLVVPPQIINGTSWDGANICKGKMQIDLTLWSGTRECVFTMF